MNTFNGRRELSSFLSKRHTFVIIAAVLMLLLVLAPALAFAAELAQLDLEQIYPTVPTEQPAAGGVAPVQQTITGESRLPDLIQYFTNWAIVLAALAAVVSLVIGGIQYLISGAYPQALQDAKKRITNSIFGLAILAGAYLILVTINPQLTVLSLVVQPVDSGIVLLTKDGYDALTRSEPEKLSDVISKGDARILASDIADSTDKAAGFGPLVQIKEAGSPVTIGGSQKVNFAKFSLYAIGFWGPAGGFSDNVKVITYDAPYFQQTDAADTNLKPREYIREGKLDTEGGTDANKGFRAKTSLSTDPPLDIILLKEPEPPQGAGAPLPDPTKTDFFFSKARHAPNETPDSYKTKVAQGKENEIFWPDPPGEVWHPPLSIRLQGIGPGVYLYSDKGGQRYLLNSHEDFSFSDIKFDNLADKIEINNYEKEDKLGEPTHNYLAVLHDYYHFSGNLRFFFTTSKAVAGEGPFVPKIYLSDKFKQDKIVLCDKARVPGDEGETCDIDNAGNDFLMKDLGIYHKLQHRYVGQLFRAGNIDLGVAPNEKKTLKVPINGISDIYGVIKESEKASSLQLFEILPAIALTEDFSWREFAKGKGREEECREVRICTKKGTAGDCISYTPGGRFFPGAYNSITLPMPFFMPVSIPKKLKGVMKIADKAGDKYEVKEEDFADEIKSITIRGDCLVALFENPVENLAVDQNTKIFTGSWKGGTPGSHSEVFLKSDWNLTDNTVGQCGGASGLGLVEPKSCVSAIAVFPIRIIEE